MTTVAFQVFKMYNNLRNNLYVNHAVLNIVLYNYGTMDSIKSLPMQLLTNKLRL